MNEFSKIKEEDKKEWNKVIVKLPKKTNAVIINYIYQDEFGNLNLGNSQYGTEDIKKMIIKE